MQASIGADTASLPNRVANKPSEALPIVEERLTQGYDAEVAEIVITQLQAWDDLGYSSEYAAVLWDVAAEVTGQPAADYDDLRMGLDAWRSEGIVYQPVTSSHA